MDIEKIREILDYNADTIISADSFSERINVVYDLLDKGFPKSSVVAAAYGPVTRFFNYMSRAEIEPLLQVLKKLSETGHKYVTTDKEMNTVLEVIYDIVEK